MYILSSKLIKTIEWVVRAVLQEFSKQSLYLKWSIYNSFEEKELHSFGKKSLFDMTHGRDGSYSHQMYLQQIGV